MSLPFPFLQYCSTLGVYCSLLLFTVFFIPRTSLLWFESASQFPFAQVASSLDRPQSRFLEPLTASPTLTLGWICLGIALLVVWWSKWIRSWVYDEHRYGSKQNHFEAKTEQLEWQKHGSSELRRACLATFVVSIFYNFIIVLFGAPISSNHLQTYLLALQLSLLTILPSAYVIGTPSLAKSDSSFLVLRYTWTRLFAEFSPKNGIERAILYPVVGTFLGSWLGCIPIGLDWDRPWQAWPLTPAYGSVIGYVLGSMSALVVSSFFALANEGNAASAAGAAKSGTGKVKTS